MTELSYDRARLNVIAPNIVSAVGSLFLGDLVHAENVLAKFEPHNFFDPDNYISLVDGESVVDVTARIVKDDAEVSAFTSGLRGNWVTATSYVIGDIVFEGLSLYIALTNHTSDADFATDLAASRWEVYSISTNRGEIWEFRATVELSDGRTQDFTTGPVTVAYAAPPPRTYFAAREVIGFDPIYSGDNVLSRMRLPNDLPEGLQWDDPENWYCNNYAVASVVGEVLKNGTDSDPDVTAVDGDEWQIRVTVTNNRAAPDDYNVDSGPDVFVWESPVYTVQDANPVAVDGSGELAAAIAAAQPGDVITLADGDYGALTLTGEDMANWVKIRAANPHGAKFNLIRLEGGSSYWHFEDVEVTRESIGLDQALVLAISASDITFHNLRLIGPDTSDYWRGVGIDALGSARVRISDCFADTLRIHHVIQTSDRVEVSGCSLPRMGEDFFKIAGVNFGTWVRNRGAYECKMPPGGHADFIQIQSAIPCSFMVFRLNYQPPYTLAAQPQGIFTTQSNQHNRWLVEQNWFWTRKPRGISISGREINARYNTGIGNVLASGVDGPSGPRQFNNIWYATNPNRGVLGTSIYAQNTHPANTFYINNYYTEVVDPTAIAADERPGMRPVAESDGETKGAFILANLLADEAS